MTASLREVLDAQLATSWALLEHHVTGLSTEEMLWRPADRGLHVVRLEDGSWQADWPETEGYDLGPPSIAWVSWHITFWWSMALNHSFDDASLQREEVTWPGSAEATVALIRALHARWTDEVSRLSDAELGSSERTRWPFTERPFVRVLAWLNVELMKNAAEIGLLRFLSATRESR